MISQKQNPQFQLMSFLRRGKCFWQARRRAQSRPCYRYISTICKYIYVQMLLTGCTSAGSDLSKQALLHINIYRCTFPCCPLLKLYMLLCKRQRSFTWDSNFMSLLYSIILQGLKASLISHPSPLSSISVLSRLTSRVRGLAFNSHQRFRFHQFLWNFHLLCTGAIFLRYPSEAASQRVAEAWFPQNWNKFASHDGFFISGWITLYIN